MKFLIPVNSAEAALAPIDHLVAANRQGNKVEALLLNVQRPFNRRVSRFTRRVDRDAFRAERSRAIMASAIELLSRAGIPFRAMTTLGSPAERIAEVADAQRVDEILMGVGRHPQSLAWLYPSMPRAVAAHTDVPVVVLARGKASKTDRYLLWASIAGGVAGIAALLLSVDY
jgi:nucleotide-binding universal stress UspA family protein